MGGFAVESGVSVYEETPFSRMTLRVATIGGVVLLVVAGLLVFWVTPTVDRGLDCYSAWGPLAVIGGVLAAMVGLVIAGFSLKEIVQARSWAGAQVVFAAVALVVCAIAAIYLYDQTWGSAYCEPS